MFSCLLFSSGIFQPPRRSEFANVKINNYDKEKDNYLLKNKIIFNNYKTAKKYGRQVYDINPNIMPILKKFLKINKTRLSFSKRRWILQQ
jgi:hypothetical protein